MTIFLGFSDVRKIDLVEFVFFFLYMGLNQPLGDVNMDLKWCFMKGRIL